MNGQRPDWFPDWSGECVAIVAAGPSVKREHVEMLRNRIHVVAVNTSYELCPWADMLYACDAIWWRSFKGAPTFSGLKVTQATEPDMNQWPEIKRVQIRRNNNAVCHDFLMEKYGEIGGGGHSGFQALNLVAQTGATAVALVGYDMRFIGESVHWHGRHHYNMNNPIEQNFRVWIEKMTAAAPRITKLGIDVVNCSPESALGCFPKMTVEKMLERWRL